MSVKAYFTQHPLIDELGPEGRRATRRGYQRYFAIAFAVAGAVHIGGMAGGWAFQEMMSRRAERQAATRTVKLVAYRDIAPPPSLEAKPAEPPKFAIAAPKFKAPPAGIPVPVPKEEAKVTTIASQVQMPFASAEGDTGLGTEDLAGLPTGIVGGEGIQIEEEVLPGVGDFVPVEEQPLAVEKPFPEYPELARLAKIEGTVLVRALVGKDGKVRDVVLSKSVNQNLDHAAMDAARRWVFKPAMQNKKPVAVWVAIPFKFTLYN